MSNKLLKRKCEKFYSYRSSGAVVPILKAIASSPFMAISTGITSALYSGLHNIVLITPLPAPIIMPTGPFRLSTQPGKGSW